MIHFVFNYGITEQNQLRNGGATPDTIWDSCTVAGYICGAF